MNLFDSANYPSSEPAELHAGDRWAWKRTDLSADYPTATYALSYVARLNGTGTTSFTITASETGGEFVVEVASSTTAGYTAGTYTWVAYITRSSDSQRIEVATGTLVVVPNRATATTDPRSWAQITLDVIEAYLRDSNNISAASYQINGRSLSRWARAELLKERDLLKAEIGRAAKAERMAKGLGTSAKINVRFTT